MAIVTVKNLRKSFKTGLIPKSTEVLKGLDFDIEASRITGFLGANGAGKTTTIKCMLNLIFPTEGSIQYFDGQEISEDVKRRIGFLPERPYFYDYLTGYEFLNFYGSLSTNLTRFELDQRIDQLLDRVRLSHAKKKQLRDYSKGMLQRVGVAQALIHKPEFVILDEPMSGLDPDGRYEVNEIIRETRAEGTAVFFSSHLLNDAEKICENLVVLKQGEVVFQGKTSELLRKVDATVRISFSKDGEIETESGLIESAVDSKIDELRRNKFRILEVVRERATLEEAFVKIAMSDSLVSKTSKGDYENVRGPN